MDIKKYIEENRENKLTDNFRLWEFIENKWATPEEIERIYETYIHSSDLQENIQELAENFQVLRNELGKAITINIGLRPLWWEIARNRSGGSMHVYGKAGDIVVKGTKPKEVAKKIQELIDKGEMSKGGLKAYSTFTHYDTRGRNARW